MDCEKCNSKKTYAWAERLTLIGGFNTRLCTKCQNEWHLYVTRLPIWEELRELRLRGDGIHAVTKKGEDPIPALRPILDRLLAIDRELYDVGRVWVEGSGSQQDDPAVVANDGIPTS
jgi:hypothetical protein